jgi:Sir2 family
MAHHSKPAQKAAKGASKKSKRHLQCEPPFALYMDEKRPSFAEGWASVVKLLQGRKNIAVLTGAGISVSCGIPDFRTKGSGLYSTLDAEVRLQQRGSVDRA